MAPTNPETPTRSGPTWLAVAGVCLAPLALRAALVREKLEAAGIPDLRGALSDGATALLAAGVILAAGRLSRALAAVLAAVWVALNYASYETIRALDAVPALSDVRFLFEPTFARGSALAISNPLLLFALFAGVPLAAVLGVRGRPGWTSVLSCAVAAAALLGLHASIDAGAAGAGWRHRHALHQNAIWSRPAWLASGAAVPGVADPIAAVIERAPDQRADLSGSPIVRLGGEPVNVLLVFLEGVSGAYVPLTALEHGRRGAPMEKLDRIARSGIAYSTFIAHQRKTNRGLYASLCGDLPNLLHATPKMTIYAQGDRRRCLPAILAEIGYRTAYLQAAPLAFMLKDQFMPRAGFEEVHGHDWLGPGYASSEWGIDDKAFFEQALGLVDSLAAGGQPWFLSLLTVGTHHPSIVPENYRPDLSRLRASLLYLDEAISEFVSALEARGVLENTLVLITSDESRGTASQNDKAQHTMSQNWGFLVALAPGESPRVVSEPFAQMDLPLSILDYLGRGDEGRPLLGRSVFRRYAEPRHLFFANTNLRTAGVIDGRGGLVLCFDDFERCRRFRSSEGRTFSPLRSEEPWSDADGALLRDVALRSVQGRRDELAATSIELVAEPTFTLAEPELRILQGGQYVDLDAGDWAEVDIEFDAIGESDARGVFEHFVTEAGVHELQRFRRMFRAGETVSLRYTYAPDSPRTEVSCRSFARLAKGAPMELRFRRATLTVHREGAHPGSGIRLAGVEARVQRPGRAR